MIDHSQDTTITKTSNKDLEESGSVRGSIISENKQNSSSNTNNDVSLYNDLSKDIDSNSIFELIEEMKSKNIYLISKTFEQKIPLLYHFLLNDQNFIEKKIELIKFIKLIFSEVDFNSEIFIRKNILYNINSNSEKEKFDLFKILIYEYINDYKNLSQNTNIEKQLKEYRSELISLFVILLSKVTISRDTYHYILSFIINFMNKQNNNNTNTPTDSNNEELTKEKLARIMELLQKFYHTTSNMNYFFFSGDSISSIIIPNKENIKDNKKILNLEEPLYVLMFIKILPENYLKTIFDSNENFKLFELRFCDKNKNISINIDIDRSLYTNFTPIPLVKLSDKDINCILFKFKKEKKVEYRIYLNNQKINIPFDKRDKESNNSNNINNKDKDNFDIKELVFFSHFIGQCYNIMIYKNKKNERLPKFMAEETKNTLNPYPKEEDKKKSINSVNKFIPYFYNGINSEELFAPFIRSELKDEVDPFYIDQYFPPKKNNFSEVDIKEFLEKNLISIYIPNRIDIPPQFEEKSPQESPKLILRDSINNLDGELFTENPSLNGVHIYKSILNDFNKIGGLNNLLPIIETMIKYPDELLTKENLANFFLIIILIFSPHNQAALEKEKDSEFFLFLSYFLEKIPENLFDSSLGGNLKSINSFLISCLIENKPFFELTEQFHKNIIMNEKILFKFNYVDQSEILGIISYSMQSIETSQKKIDIDIITLIKILLDYDKSHHELFCCKEHSEYFIKNNETNKENNKESNEINNNNDKIMSPKLKERIKPVEEIIKIFLWNYYIEKEKFKEMYKKKQKEKEKDKDKGTEKKDELFEELKNKLLKDETDLINLFSILSFDCSPCIQKMIITLFDDSIRGHLGMYLINQDKDNKIINIAMFVFKNSIFDVKIDALKLILLMTKNKKLIHDNKLDDGILLSGGSSISRGGSSNNISGNVGGGDKNVEDENYLFGNDEEIFMSNYILPFYLFEDNELLEMTTIDESNNENNEKEFKINEFKIEDFTSLEKEDEKDGLRNDEKKENDKNEDKEDKENKDTPDGNNDKKEKTTETDTEKDKDKEKNETEAEKKEEEKEKITPEGNIKKKEEEVKPKTEEPKKSKIIIEDYFIEKDEKIQDVDNADPLDIKNLENLNLKKDLSDNSNIANELYGNSRDGKLNKSQIKKSIKKNNLLYNLISVTPIQRKIHRNYNKSKLNELINGLFKELLIAFHEGVCVKLCLNLLLKVVSKGDFLLISNFIDNIDNINLKNFENKNVQEIYNNENLLHWLIETSFQAYMIKKSKLNQEVFKSGFNLEVKGIDDKEKMEKIEQIYKTSIALLKKIFNNHIYKMDYLFSWSKYYYELRNETNNFQYVRDLVMDFLFEIGYNTCEDITSPDIMNIPKQKMAVYFFNLLFEFVTFYKLKSKDLDNIYKNKESIYAELQRDFKLIFITEMDDIRKSLRPLDLQEPIEKKFTEYLFFNTLFVKLSPLWKGEKKSFRQENDIYSKYISNKKNIDINELELLFYSFKDITELKKDIYANKGTPLIYIIYHFFTLIFSIGGTEAEIKDLFIDFRLFILLLIISSSTLTTSGSGKKKKWPNDEQYKEVQKTIEAILFNFIYFLGMKLKETMNKIMEMEEEEKNDQKVLTKNEIQYKQYLNQIQILMIGNLAYFLKILNKMYREITKIEKEKKNSSFSAIGTFFKDIKVSVLGEKEGVKKSGCYQLIEKIYNECPSLLGDKKEEKNCLDNLSDIYLTKKDSNFFFEEGKILEQLKGGVLSFIYHKEIEIFFNKHNEEYIEILFPFFSYIKRRKQLVNSIIPVYDNRANINFYPEKLCLIPEYFPEAKNETKLTNEIKKYNKDLDNELQLNGKKYKIDLYEKKMKYIKIKKKLFSFCGIWSNEEFFYNKDKYKLKYKLINHLTEDYTKIFLKPIIDMDYYLPIFSKFVTSNLFRNPNDSKNKKNKSKNNNNKIKTVCKITDLSFDLTNRNRTFVVSEINQNNTEEVVNVNNINIKNKKNRKETTDSILNNLLNNNSTNNEEINSNINEEEDEKKNMLYDIGKESFNFLDEINLFGEIKYISDLKLFTELIKKKHSLDFKKNCIEADACLIKQAFHIRGIIYNNDKEIGFYSYEKKRLTEEEDYDSDRKVCFGSIFMAQLDKYNFYCIRIPFSKIQMIFKRRYFFKKTGIEIYTEDKKSYFFRIDENKIKDLYINIRHYMKSDIEDIFIEYSKFDEKIGFINRKNSFINCNPLLSEKKGMNLRTLYDKWVKWDLNTLKLLMILNIYANRSYNDVNQYPVFPWIITDYVSDHLPPMEKEFFIRPLGKPMGMLDFTEDAKERKENYEAHWKSNELDEDRDDNYDRYGSHYSTSLYLTYYLVRVFPFSYIRIELQGKNFDDPNRLFNSLPDSFDCALTQKSDLRELIPEFFCFPEMFFNINDLNLGEIVDSSYSNEEHKMKLVNDVDMPNWSNLDAYEFIKKHRELLESSEISEKINEWINIIFGSKQKGKEAKKIRNLFIKQTYEDFEESYNKSTSSEKIYQKRMVEFGVTPHQLFKNDTYKRQHLNENKIKKSLLYNISKNYSRNYYSIGSNDFVTEEIKYRIIDNPFKIFTFLRKIGDKKKERLCFLFNDKIRVFSKVDGGQLLSIQQNKNTDENKNDDNDGDRSFEDDNDNIINDINNLDDKKESQQIKFTIKSKYDKKLFIPRYRINNKQAPCLLFDNGCFIVFGGFWNGDIILDKIGDYNIVNKNKNKKIIIYPTEKQSPIKIMLIDKSESFIYCTNTEGDLIIFSIDSEDKSVWTKYKFINEGKGEIVSMNLNENLNIFITCYKDGCSMLYTLPTFKLFNSFKIDQKKLFHIISTAKVSDVPKIPPPPPLILNKPRFLKNTDIPTPPPLPLILTPTPTSQPETSPESTPTPPQETPASTPSPTPNPDENGKKLDGIEKSVKNNIDSKIYPNLVIISHTPLPSFIFYIKSISALCVYSINGHYLKSKKLGYEIVPNGIKKYTDFNCKEYLFIYNSNINTFDVYDCFNLNIIARSPVIGHTFEDFLFTRESDYALILVKTKPKTGEKNPGHKVLILRTPGNDIEWK